MNGGLQMEAIGAPMDAERRVAAAGHLEDLLVDLITLSLNTKQAHWHVTGRNFLPVHEHLDTIYTFLHKVNVIDVSKAPAGAIDDSVARAVAQEAKATVPLGIIKPLPASKAPKD